MRLLALLLLAACGQAATVPLVRDTPVGPGAWADWSDRLEHFERLELQLDVDDCPALGAAPDRRRYGGPRRARLRLIAHADGRVLVARAGAAPVPWTEPGGLGLDPATAAAIWRAVRSASSSFTATEVPVEASSAGTFELELVPDAPLGAVDRVSVLGRPRWEPGGPADPALGRPSVVRPIVATPTWVRLPGCSVIVTAWWQDVAPPGSAP